MFTHPRSAPVFGDNYDDNSFDIPNANANELLSELGYSADTIAELKAKNITP